MHQLQIKLGSLPISLVLISDGSVAFVKSCNFKAICDSGDDDGKQIVAIFDNEGFQLGNTDNFCYNVAYRYKEIPDMLKYLQQQNLQEPQGVFFGGI